MHKPQSQKTHSQNLLSSQSAHISLVGMGAAPFRSNPTFGLCFVGE